jgi:hypothetical protein
MSEFDGTISRIVARDEFRQWLERCQFEGTTVVGTRNTGDWCPIAMFLHAKLGPQAEVSVDDEIVVYVFDEDEQYYWDHEEWSRCFISKIDENVDWMGKKVGPREALGVLKRCP